MYIYNTIFIIGNVLFKNDSACNGTAMYLDEKPKNPVLKFIEITAFSNGGTIFVELTYGCTNYQVLYLNL